MAVAELVALHTPEGLVAQVAAATGLYIFLEAKQAAQPTRAAVAAGLTTLRVHLAVQELLSSGIQTLTLTLHPQPGLLRSPIRADTKSTSSPAVGV
jgi:archaellin